MSPPSLATAGRTRSSISSLMVATVSESSGAKNSSSAADPPDCSVRVIGSPDMKCSIIAPRIAGVRCCQSPPALVTATKSEPRNTPATPGIANRCSASGDWVADCASRMSSVPLASTVRPGRNLRVAGFGVASVWMNMAVSSPAVCPIGRTRASSNKWLLGNELQAPAGHSRGSRHCVQILIAQVPRHDCDRDRKLAGGPAYARNERTRSFRSQSGGEHEQRNILIIFDQLQQFLGLVALADNALRHHSRNGGGTGSMPIQHGIGFLVGLRAHDVSDAQPLLGMIMRFDDPQHQHGCADPQRAAGCEVQGTVAFGRIVDDHQKLWRMSGFVAAALLPHVLSGGLGHGRILPCQLVWVQ